MGTQSDNDCFSYVLCPEAPFPVWILLGCISSESLNDDLQTSAATRCRKNNDIRQNVDGNQPSANFQLELTDDDDKQLFRWFRRAAKSCKEVCIAYLDAEITDPDIDGSVMCGAVSTNWTRNTDGKNLAVSQVNTGGYFCWDEWLASGGTTNVGSINDLPLLA